MVICYLCFLIANVACLLHYAWRIWKNVASRIIAYVSDGKAANNDELET